MILEQFPTEFLEVLMGVIKDNSKDYQLVSATKVNEKHTDVELQGVNEPIDLLILGIRIGMDHADRRSIERIVPEVVKLVEKDLQQSQN